MTQLLVVMHSVMQAGAVEGLVDREEMQRAIKHP